MQTMHRLLLLSLALVALASAAHAQSGVSNLAVTPLGDVYKDPSVFLAQSFITGASANPFQLSAVTLPLSGSSITDFTVQIRSNASGIPGAVLSTLTGTSSPTGGQYDFVNGSVVLDASTTYWVTWGFTSSGSGYFSSPQMVGYAATGDWTLGNNTSSYNNGANWYSPNPGYTFAISVQGMSAVPEPSTYAALVGVGVLGFALWRRRKTV